MSPSGTWSERWNRLPAGRRRLLAGLAVALALTAVGVYRMRSRSAAGRDVPLFETRRGPLLISLTESGSIQSRDKVIVRSDVGGRNTIVYLIPEGRTVAAGDLLVELDSTSFEQSRLEQDIRVQNAESALIQSRENLEVTRNQAQANIEEATLSLRFARLALEKYEEGEYPQQLQQAEAEITIAQEELRRTEDTLEWSRQLAEEGFITRSELQADELARQRRSLDLDLARGRLRVFRQFTYVQTLERLQSDITQADMALDRVRRRASADIIRAEADLRAKESEHRQQVTRLEQLDAQIAACRITAPADGMVVYATSVSTRRFGSQQPLDVGQEVSHRQELIHLPAARDMIADIRIQEASLTKVSIGLDAVITVDALPGRVFRGRLDRISVLPDSSQSWLNPDLKLYNGEVALLGTDPDLRPGMSCRVEVIVARLEDAHYVPVQAVVRQRGQPMVYVQGSREAVPRVVEIGLDNNRMVHILSGLSEGEPVLLAPPLPEARPGEEKTTGNLASGLSAPPAMPGSGPVPDGAPAADGERANGERRRPEGRARREGATEGGEGRALREGAAEGGAGRVRPEGGTRVRTGDDPPARGDTP